MATAAVKRHAGSMQRLARAVQALCLLAFFTALAGPGQAARLEVLVDLGDQTMVVRLDGEGVGVWPVSTAREGKVTPTGLFQPEYLKRMHYSTLYDNAPMPYSIFFSGNYAIHGTTATDRLGSPASAGCIRLHPDDARQLFELVREVGRAETLIEIRP